MSKNKIHYLITEKIMENFNRESFISSLDNAKHMIDKATKLGTELANKSYDTLLFVGCGAPYHMVQLINHYANIHIKNTRIENYLPAEFIDINPSFVNDRTIVIFGSYSGTTKETVNAAKFCRDKTCLTISITRFDDSPLSKNVKTHLNYGETKLGDYSRFMVTSAFVSGFLSIRESTNWGIHDKMIRSLKSLPKLLADVVGQSEDMVKQFSEIYHKFSSIFVVGNGPVYNTAYILAFCSFIEMQWIHATPILAAEFFHGAFELLDDSFPVIVLIGEDETRKEGIRVEKFCRKNLKNFIVFDSIDYDMQDIDSELRSYFSPVVIDAATRRLMDYYADLRGHDKSKRRYMGVIEY